MAGQDAAVADATRNIVADQPELRLIAMDAEDLAILSAHVQDAHVAAGDLLYLAQDKRFVLALSRFDWTAVPSGCLQRVAAGLHFERVLRVETARLDRSDKRAVLNLLSILFEPTEAPAGAVTLAFSAGVTIRLHVECIEAQMRDIGPRWTVGACPGHKLDAPPDQSRGDVR